MILPRVAELLARVGCEPPVRDALERLRTEEPAARLAGLVDPAKALLAAIVAHALDRPVIFVVESNRRAEELAEPVRYFYTALTQRGGSRVAVFPAHEVFPYDGRSPHPEISQARGVALWRMASGEADIVLAAVTAALWRLREPEFYRELGLSVARDQELAHQSLVEHLSRVGYDRQEMVQMPGQFAVRGGIVDVFSAEAARPVRLELLGDTVESLREFDPTTQRSTGPIESATLLPLADIPRQLDLLESFRAEPASSGCSDEGLPAAFFPGWEFRAALAARAESNLLGLLPHAVLLEDEPETLALVLQDFRARLAGAHDKARNGAAPPESYFLAEEEWQRVRVGAPRLGLERLEIAHEERETPSLRTQPTTRYHGNVTAFMAEIRSQLGAGGQVLVAASSTGELERLADLCHENELPYLLGELEAGATSARLAEESSAGSVPALVLLKAPVAEGAIFPQSRLALYGNADLFDTLPAPERPRRRAKAASFRSDLSALKPGDLVIHMDHGIGRFDGLRQLTVNGASGDFMLLTYAGDARLYVPLARLDLVQRYQSLGGAVPPLDRLGGGAWEARKARVQKSVGEMAQKLLLLYAERKARPGNAFSADTPWQKEFEDAFEYEETPDQARAIEEAKRDLESQRPMDRLVCGDVGYGKTEVAMRAAFKVVADSKQVAVLAPTTVLAFQHYETFRRRFSAFPIRVEMLSRFHRTREQKRTLEGLAAGHVDIVIGTHRLLSRDVEFHDLGLLVVDEEQRFGVAHKERLKQLCANVDVLTMSATPIPRTLHMSLAGLRDMSVIETPPKDRLAIQTVVAPFDEALVKRALEQELERDGQVYFVHNRVQSIQTLAAMVKRLVPHARVVVGHGQMKEAELEKVMLKFIRGEANVLVATAIIENGLDIPRANTILVNRADRFGLAELYQLRGRVGRSNQRAYAYLFVPRGSSLSPLARERLAGLKEFSELGAGFRIAALDLELRGAGNLLGREQHGHIAAVGFDLYCQMLERAVAARKGEVVVPERRAALNLGLDIRIPADYIESESLRLTLYKRIAGISSEAEREEVRRELRDRFGPPPPAIARLLDYAVLKATAERLLVASIERRGDQLAIRFHDDTPVRPERLVEILQGWQGMRLDPSGVLWVDCRGEADGRAEAARNVLLQLQA